MKKLILLLIFIPLISYSQDIKNEVLQEINLSKIPAVVMGKINKNGKIGKIIDFVSKANENNVAKNNKDLVFPSEINKQ